MPAPIGYETERLRLVVWHERHIAPFERLDSAQVVSFTAPQNRPSRAVMERIGMIDTQQDFDHPAVPEGSDLRRHCLYTITRERWDALGGGGA